MDFATWLLQFVMWANVLTAQGYVYELNSGYFRDSQGNRLAITGTVAPRRGN